VKSKQSAARTFTPQIHNPVTTFHCASDHRVPTVSRYKQRLSAQETFSYLGVFQEQCRRRDRIIHKTNNALQGFRVKGDDLKRKKSRLGRRGVLCSKLREARSEFEVIKSARGSCISSWNVTMLLQARPQRTATGSRNVSHFGLDVDMLSVIMALSKVCKQRTML